MNMSARKFTTLFILLFILTACGGSDSPQPTAISNNAPISTDDSANLIKNETKNITLSATDSDGDALTYTISTAPQHGVITVSGNVATYIPTNDYVGSDSFSFVASDGQINSNQATIGITVAAPPNAAPVATNGSADLIKNETKNITLSADDSDGNALTYTISTAPQHGVITISGNVASYLPTNDYVGSDNFNFVANDGQVDSNTATVTLEIAATSNISAIITTIDGSVVAGVSVDVIDSNGNTLESLQSNNIGQFLVSAKPESDLVFRLSKNGFANQIIPAQTPSLANLSVTIDITMMARNPSQTLDIDAGGTLNSTQGAKVTVSSNSFVDAQGNAVTGNIDVNITPVDVSNTLLLNAFPGQFTGISDSNGQSTTIATLGTVEFLFSQNGQPLQLADGATAQIELPLFITTHPATNLPINVGDTIELWYLDENSGIWHQEGTGTVVVNTSSPTGFALLATVSHFTWWNIDVPIDTFNLNVDLNGTVNGGAATIFVDLGANSPMWLQNASRHVIVGTSSHYLVPISNQVCVWIQYFDVNNASALSPQQCINAPISGGNYPLTFNVPTAGSLTLHSYNRSTYYTGQPMRISIVPLSLESAVSYAITSGSLPTGISLVNVGVNDSRLIGTPTAIGSHVIVIQGTDSDGFTNNVTLSFSVINPPAPTLKLISTIYSGLNQAISKNLSTAAYRVEPVTSWTITNSDASPVAAGISISNSGVLTIANFDGVAASYHVIAYNIRGASNVGTINVTATVTPVLQSSLMIYGDFSDPQSQNNNVNENLASLNSTALATSWHITEINGSPVPASVAISNSGQLTLPGSETMRSYHVTASNSEGVSNVMIVSFFDITAGCMDPITCL